MADYTGPTAIRMTDTGIHIDGYPEAQRLGKVTTPAARHLAHLRLHRHDLQFCEDAMQQLRRFEESSDEPGATLYLALWTAVLVKFFGCFSHSGARERLDQAQICSGEPTALEAFEYLRNLRNKHVVHDENNYYFSETAVVLDKDNRLLDILSLMISGRHGRSDHQNMFNLITHAKSKVDGMIEEVLNRIRAEFAQLSDTEISGLPTVEYVKPAPSDVSMRRQK